MSQSERREKIFVVILLAAVLICWLYRFQGPIDMRWDGGSYYILGTSLAEGKGYRLLNEPGQIEAVQYPPLLPAIIAVYQLSLGTSDPLIVGPWLRITSFIIFIIYILSIYFLARYYLPSSFALFVSLVCLFTLQTLFSSDLCFPEIPFSLAVTLFFICHMKSDKPIYGVLTPIFAVAAYTLRTSGIALLAAWVGESILKKEFKRAILRLAVSAAAVLGWMTYISAVEASHDYNNPAYEYQRAAYLFYNVSYGKNIFLLKDPMAPEMGPASLSDISDRFLNNLKSIPAALGEVFTTNKSLWETELDELNKISPLKLGKVWMIDIPLILLGLLVLGGTAIQLYRREWILTLFILFSIAIICLTPWPEQFNRYFGPVLPILAICLFALFLKFITVLDKVQSKRWRSYGMWLIVAVAAVIVTQKSITYSVIQGKWHRDVGYLGRHGENVSYRLYFYFDSNRAFDEGIDWLMSIASPGDVVASSMPHWIYIRSGLKSIMPPFESNAAEAQRLLDTVPVTYLIVDEGLALDTKKYTLPVVEAFPDKWERVYSSSNVKINGNENQRGIQIFHRITDYSNKP
jgi:4-amino-4-deoxy-L-arabinose transferase-like glycosyltransferase